MDFHVQYYSIKIIYKQLVWVCGIGGILLIALGVFLMIKFGHTSDDTFYGVVNNLLIIIGFLVFALALLTYEGGIRNANIEPIETVINITDKYLQVEGEQHYWDKVEVKIYNIYPYDDVKPPLQQEFIRDDNYLIRFIDPDVDMTIHFLPLTKAQKNFLLELRAIVLGKELPRIEV